MRRRNVDRAEGNEQIETTGTGDKNKKKSSKNKEKESSAFNRRCRFIMTVMKYLLMSLFIPPFLNYASLNFEYKQLKPPGLLYDVGFGQKLFLGCHGTGKPTVILDAPIGQSSDVWSNIVPALAQKTKVCVYDRAGLGFSERPFVNQSADAAKNRWKAFTVERMADDLYRLLTQSSQQEQPFVLVGAGLGGLVARFYAHLFESSVSDVVLINPLVEEVFEQENKEWVPYWHHTLIPAFQSLQLSAAVGLSRLGLITGLMTQPLEQLPEDADKRQKFLLCNPRHLSSVVDEHFFINDSFSQIKTLGRLKPFPSNISVTVINSLNFDPSLPDAINKAWQKSQDHLAQTIYPSAKRVTITDANRDVITKNPRSVLHHLMKVVQQQKTKSVTLNGKGSVGQ